MRELSLRAEALTLRAEVLCAELLANGLAADRLEVELAGSFRKRYSRDIETVKMEQDADPGGGTAVRITVNRDGIYDLLPEGLFHQPMVRSTGLGLRDVISDIRRQKEEEKSARLFFQPLEMELLRMGIGIEQAERSWLAGLPDHDGFVHLMNVWGLPAGLPYKAMLSLIRMLPWAHLIRGEAAATRKVLELMLGVPVTLEQRVIEWQQPEWGKDGTASGPAAAATPGPVAGPILGENTVLGESFPEPGFGWHFRIAAMDPAAFLPGNDYERLLDTFQDIFIPMEIDVFFDYAPVREPATTPILGYGTFL